MSVKATKDRLALRLKGDVYEPQPYFALGSKLLRRELVLFGHDDLVDGSSLKHALPRERLQPPHAYWTEHDLIGGRRQAQSIRTETRKMSFNTNEVIRRVPTRFIKGCHRSVSGQRESGLGTRSMKSSDRGQDSLDEVFFQIDRLLQLVELNRDEISRYKKLKLPQSSESLSVSKVASLDAEVNQWSIGRHSWGSA